MATRAEYTEWKYSEKKSTEKVNKSVKNIKQSVNKQIKEKVETQPTSSAKDLFDELFGEK
jgi:hypothetical protein